MVVHKDAWVADFWDGSNWNPRFRRNILETEMPTVDSLLWVFFFSFLSFFFFFWAGGDLNFRPTHQKRLELHE